MNDRTMSNDLEAFRRTASAYLKARDCATEEPAIVHDEIEMIEARLARAIEAVRSHGRARVKAAWDAGRELLRAKEKLDHGEWLPWLEKMGVARRTASSYMRIAAEVELARLAHFETLTELRASLKPRKPRKPAADGVPIRRHRVPDTGGPTIRSVALRAQLAYLLARLNRREDDPWVVARLSQVKEQPLPETQNDHRTMQGA